MCELRIISLYNARSYLCPAHSKYSSTILFAFSFSIRNCCLVAITWFWECSALTYVSSKDSSEQKSRVFGYSKAHQLTCFHYYTTLTVWKTHLCFLNTKNSKWLFLFSRSQILFLSAPLSCPLIYPLPSLSLTPFSNLPPFTVTLANLK